MEKNDYPGKLIVFDGLDGSGLSTQGEKLTRFLNRKGKDFELGFSGAKLTKEPTPGGLIGGLINARLDGVWKSSNTCLQLLFTADRAYHLEKKVVPLLRKGVWVVCDRYLFSTVAFGQLNGLEEEWLLTLQEHFLVPDLTFFLEVSPEECIRRIRENRFGTTLFEERKVFEKVWDNYEALAEDFEGKVRIVDGERPIEEVAEEIKKITKNVFNL